MEDFRILSRKLKISNQKQLTLVQVRVKVIS